MNSMCYGTWELWDQFGYPSSCWVDLGLPLILLAMVIIGGLYFVYYQYRYSHYTPLATDSNDHDVNINPFWRTIHSTLVFAGLVTCIIQVSFLSMDQDGLYIVSAGIYLAAWTLFWFGQLRLPHLLSHSYLALFAVYNVMSACFRIASFAYWNENIVTTLKVTIISHFIISSLLALSCVISLISHINERQVKWSYRVPISAAEPLPTLETHVSWLERLTFIWITPLLLRGERSPLQKSDIWGLYHKDQAKITHQSFLSYFHKHDTTIFSALYQMIRHLLVWQIIFGLICGILEFVGPFFLNQIIGYLESKKQNLDPISHINVIDNNDNDSILLMPWVYILGLFLGTILKTLADNRAFFLGRRIAIRVKASLISQIYDKVLRRRLHGTNIASIGELNTLFAVDVDKIAEFTAYVQNIFAVPLSLIVALISLYKLLDWSALFGVGLMIVYLPLQSFTGRLIQRRQRKLREQTDQRVSLANEMLQSIRMIKFFHYEPKFEEQLNTKRNNELTSLLKFGYFCAFVQVLFRSLPIFVSFATFTSYVVLQGGTLTVTTVFTALSLFSLLKGPLYQLPMIVVRLLELRVSLDRITKLMHEEEIDIIPSDSFLITTSSSTNQSSINSTHGFPHPFIEFSGNATFGWSSDNSGFHLRDINIRFKPRGLNVIIGQVGSGKSSLLLALLGEMYTKSGLVTKPDSIAYVAQSAWLQSDTIQSNITFGSDFNEQLYRKVISACALERDLQILDKGDETEIGERGVVLSGGQRQRIALARATLFACIHGEDTVMVADDVLSAVDAPTGRHIFDECVLGLLGNHTRILVTHATGLVLPNADHIIVMDQGKVITQGNIIECRQALQESHLLKLLGSSDLDTITNAPNNDDNNTNQISISSSSSPSSSPLNSNPSISDINKTTNNDNTIIELEKENTVLNDDTNQIKKLIEDEAVESGRVPWSVYVLYFTAAGGIPYWLGILGTQLLLHFMGVAGDNVLRMWAAAPTTQFSYIGIYAAFGAGQLFVSYWYPIISMYGSIRASRIMHEKLVECILRAPISFFDKTPLGRIVNRLSKDMHEIDQDVSQTLSWFLMMALDFVTAIVLVTFVTPSFLLFLPLIFWAYWQVAKRYLSSSRELKRLDSTSRSPIYSAFSETLNGVQTVRAFGQTKRFINDMYKRVDNNMAPWWLLWMANRWLNIRTQVLDATLVTGAAIAIVIGVHIHALDASWAGLALTYAIGIGESILWLTRIQSYMEMSMNAVQRVHEYSQIPSEAPVILPYRPPSDWPNRGQIDIKELVIQYPNSDKPALDRITIHIPAGKKIGIVGRTGAGKSSLTLALFRMWEPKSGRILIDGIDIQQIGVGDLRSRLTVIPQDPAMFQGTIRYNLDMFNEHTDEEIRQVLNQVNLSTIQLTDEVLEGANNWSLGQKQLIALARAFLRKSKIVLLDESTASVDSTTDSFIQQTLRNHFTNTTVLCIAHRLRTIIDYHEVIILDQGHLVESGRPYDLLLKSNTDPTAYFRRACEQSGDWDYLLSTAKSTVDISH